MKLALALDCQQDEDLIFAQQLGVTHIVARIAQAVDTGLENLPPLASLRNRVEKAGMAFAGVDGLRPHEKIILGQPGRDEEIKSFCQFIQNAGAAGIPLVGYSWALPGGPQTARIPKGRGESYISARDQQESHLTLTSEQAWENLTYFLERIIPAAEATGVKMACHPDDPPTTSAGGIPSILNSVESLERLLDISPCSHHGLDFCQGAVAAMPDADLFETIRLFGLKQKIFMAHLSNPKGKLPDATEAFLDEGDTNMVQALQTYLKVGFDGVLRPACTPGMLEDTEWGHKGHAFSVGYLRAVLQALEHVAGQMKQAG